MALTDSTGTDAENPSEASAPKISALTATPEKLVFTEEGNEDGWIATDWSVTVSR